MTGTRPGGVLQAVGSTNEPAAVTVQGRPVATGPDNTFRAPVTLAEGTTTVAVVATDGSGNTRSQSYEIDAIGSSRTMAYDANGNLTSDGQRTFTWDAENRIATVVKGGVTTAFVYNGLGQRVQTTSGATTTTYILDESSVLEERVGTVVKRHVRGPDLDWLLAVDEVGTGTTFFVGDHLKTVDIGLDGAGNVVLTREYDPFGVQSLAGTAAAGEAFTGRPWMPAIGLYDYRARSYDPDLGRFISEDPGGVRNGVNRYAYVGGNPLRYVDSTGELPRVPEWIAQMFFAAYMLTCEKRMPPEAETARKVFQALKNAAGSTRPAGGPPTPGSGGGLPGGGMLIIVVNPCLLSPKMCICTDKGCVMRAGPTFAGGPA